MHFQKWMKAWCESLPTKEKRVLLLDSVEIHKRDEVVAIAEESNVKLPPLMKTFTHMMQPLDVGVFEGVRLCGNNKSCGTMKLTLARNSMFQKDWLGQILEWLDALRGQKIRVQRLFKKTSLCPFETDAVTLMNHMKDQSLADGFKNIDLAAEVSKLAGRVPVQQVKPGETPGRCRAVFPL